MLIQLYGVGVTLAWSGVVTFVLLKVIGFFLPLRVREEDDGSASTSRCTANRCNSGATSRLQGPAGGGPLCWSAYYLRQAAALRQFG